MFNCSIMTTARAVNPGVGGLAAVARKSLKAMEDFFDGNVWSEGGRGDAAGKGDAEAGDKAARSWA